MEENKNEKKTEEKKTKKQLEDEKIASEIQSLKEQVEDYKDKWIRNVAEFDNYKKRNAKLWSDAFNEGIANVINKILPIGDSLDWALAMDLDEKSLDGIRGIRKKFDEVLASMDVEEINPVGEQFDPNIAEAVMQVDGAEGEESDSVKQVFQKGYKMKEKMIRYAKVSVIK